LQQLVLTAQAFQARIRFEDRDHGTLKASLRQVWAGCRIIGPWADSAYWERCPPQPTEIFSGVTYVANVWSQGHGILHWVRVELAAPGIELYVTPIDPSAWNTAFSIDCAGS
jgi:hypothetical protein